jgi:ElaB/YqjD/DUF883 family membrane-anchored ribosome-binding protein
MGEKSDSMTGDPKLREHDVRGRSSDEVMGRARDEALPETPEDTARIRSEIARTREDMSETIGAIQDRLSPRNLASQAKESVKEATVGRVKQAARTVSDSASGLAVSTREAAADVADSVRHNPWPALLIGAGTAWWFIDRSRQSSRRTVVDYDHDDGTTGYYETVRSAAAYGYGDAGDTSHAVRTVRNRTSQLQRLLQRNPLVVSAVAAAVGVAVGLAIPETRRENLLMGEARDNLAERAKDAAQGAVDKAKQVAGEAARQVTGAPRS